MEVVSLVKESVGSQLCKAGAWGPMGAGVTEGD